MDNFLRGLFTDDDGARIDLEEVLRALGITKKDWKPGEKEYRISVFLQGAEIFNLAVRFLELAIDLNEKEYTVCENFVGLSYMSFKIGKYSKTVLYGKKAISIEEENPFGWANAGAGYEKLCKFYCSLVYYNKAVDITVRNKSNAAFDFINGRGYVHSQLGMFLKCFQDYILASSKGTEDDSTNIEFTSFHRRYMDNLPLSSVSESLKKRLWGYRDLSQSFLVGKSESEMEGQTFRSFFIENQNEAKKSSSFLSDIFRQVKSGRRLKWIDRLIFRKRIMELSHQKSFIDVLIFCVEV